MKKEEHRIYLKMCNVFSIVNTLSKDPWLSIFHSFAREKMNFSFLLIGTVNSIGVLNVPSYEVVLVHHLSQIMKIEASYMIFQTLENDLLCIVCKSNQPSIDGNKVKLSR